MFAKFPVHHLTSLTSWQKAREAVARKAGRQSLPRPTPHTSPSWPKSSLTLAWRVKAKMCRKMFTKKAVRTTSPSVTWIHVWVLKFMQPGTFSGPRLPEAHFKLPRVACSSLWWYLRGQRASSVTIHLQGALLKKGVTFWWPEVSTKERGNRAPTLFSAVYPQGFHPFSWRLPPVFLNKRMKDWQQQTFEGSLLKY